MLRWTRIPSAAAMVAMLAVAGSAAGQATDEPPPEIDPRAKRLVNTGPVSRGALISELRRQGRPASPDEARQRGRAGAAPVIDGKEADPAVPRDAASRLDRLLRERPPTRADLIRTIESQPGGQAKLDEARRRGAPLAAGEPNDGSFLPASWAWPEQPAASLPARPVSYTLTVSNHRNSSPNALLGFRRVDLEGVYVTLDSYDLKFSFGAGSCAYLYYTIPQRGWYVISMTAVAFGPVEVTARDSNGGLLESWSSSKSGYTVLQFPAVVDHTAAYRGSNTNRVWCADSGRLLFASVTFHSF